MKIKAFFAFISKSEVTRAFGAWSLDIKKSGRRRPDATGRRDAVQSLPKDLKIKAFFAFISKSEVTRASRRWSLDVNSIRFN